MSDKAYGECIRFMARGLLVMLAGSGLLLMPRFFAVPEFWATVSILAGCGAVLYGNVCIVYGLLIHAGDRTPGGEAAESAGVARSHGTGPERERPSGEAPPRNEAPPGMERKQGG